MNLSGTRCCMSIRSEIRSPNEYTAVMCDDDLTPSATQRGLDSNRQHEVGRGQRIGIKIPEVKPQLQAMRMKLQTQTKSATEQRTESP